VRCHIAGHLWGGPSVVDCVTRPYALGGSAWTDDEAEQRRFVNADTVWIEDG
jgi:hypothetical protein